MTIETSHTYISGCQCFSDSDIVSNWNLSYCNIANIKKLVHLSDCLFKKKRKKNMSNISSLVLRVWDSNCKCILLYVLSFLKELLNWSSYKLRPITPEVQHKTLLEVRLIPLIDCLVYCMVKVLCQFWRITNVFHLQKDSADVGI